VVAAAAGLVGAAAAFAAGVLVGAAAVPHADSRSAKTAMTESHCK
jgi:hypothetical protein